MGRPKNIVPRRRLLVYVPLDLQIKIDLALYSELERRVPHGKYSAFVCDRLREHFAWNELDLGPFGLPAGFFVKGPKEMLVALREALSVVTSR